MAKAIPVFAVNPGALLQENAPLILHTRLEEMYRFAIDIADPARVAELHNMRIAAKRLRYTLEVFASCFAGKEFETLYDQVKSIQEQIGEIHDADVRGPLLQQFLDREGPARPEIRVGLQTLIQAQQAARVRRYRAFVRFWNKLQTQHFKRRFLQMLAAIDLGAEHPIRVKASKENPTPNEKNSTLS